MARDILYKPLLTYVKNYFTKGKIPIEYNIENKETIQTEIPLIQNIQSEIDSIENIAKIIPTQIKKTFFTPYIAMKYEFANIINSINSYYEDIPENPDDPKKEDDKNKDIKKEPEETYGGIPLFTREEDDAFADNIDLIKIRQENIQLYYWKDFSDIYENYLSELNKVLKNYSIKFFTITTNDMNIDIEKYQTIDLKNSNLYHLSDFIIKSKIVSDQKMRLYEKLYGIDESIVKLKLLKSTKEQFIRYYNIEKMQENNNYEQQSNDLLRNTKKLIEKKYKENLYSLYKYLNSSVILLNESLQNTSQQLQALNIIKFKQ